MFQINEHITFFVSLSIDLEPCISYFGRPIVCKEQTPQFAPFRFARQLSPIVHNKYREGQTEMPGSTRTNFHDEGEKEIQKKNQQTFYSFVVYGPRLFFSFSIYYDCWSSFFSYLLNPYFLSFLLSILLFPNSTIQCFLAFHFNFSSLFPHIFSIDAILFTCKTFSNFCFLGCSFFLTLSIDFFLFHFDFFYIFLISVIFLFKAYFYKFHHLYSSSSSF